MNNKEQCRAQVTEQMPIGMVAKSSFSGLKILVATVPLDDVELGAKLYTSPAPAVEQSDLSKAILALIKQEKGMPIIYHGANVTVYSKDQVFALLTAAAALASQPAAQEQALEILREFVRDSVEHDVGGGDVVVTTCEVLEKACKLVDSLRDPSHGVCGVKPAECPDRKLCGCERRMAAQLAQSADKAGNDHD